MRVTLRTFAVAATALALVACGDSSTAPRTASSLRPSDRGPSLDLSLGSFELGTDFTVTPTGGVFPLAGGIYNVQFPANAICDPAVSTYGPDQWNAPCTTLATGIKIHATVSVSMFGIAVDFSPSLRFSPTAGNVYLYTDVYAPIILANGAYFSANPSALRPLAMYWAPELGAADVPDYLTDPTAVTHINLSTGRVWRRIKHFSGYNVYTGLPCNPSPTDPDCIDTSGSFQPPQ